MFEVHSINAEHKDLIHDVAYDFYGRRMATCSSDQFVKVWDQDEHDTWNLTGNWKAHSGSVWKVTWAHPEFGQVLATCSFDRTAAIWEEIVGEGSVPGERGMRHWIRRTNLVDSRTSVTDVKFAPKSLGLLLATCSNDGTVRVYEAPDVMNLSQWTLQHEMTVKISCSCLSWNPSFSRLHPPMLAVGSDDTNQAIGGKVFIYEYSENTRRWSKTETLASVTDAVHDIAFAPNLGRSYHILAIATKDVRVVTLKPLPPKSSGALRTCMHVTAADVCMGLDGEHSATTKRNTMMTPFPPQLEIAGAQSGLSRFDIQLAAQFEDHYCTVWRVCWNITGTILASSGDDGCVRLWKANYMNSWKCISVLKGDGTQAQSDMVLPSSPPLSANPGVSQSTTTRLFEEAIPATSMWQAPVIKGRFQKMTWLGSDSPPPPPPPIAKPKSFKN